MLTTYWRKSALVALILLTSAVLPISAWGAGYTVYVPSPNGVNDTANLQGALDSCVAYGRGCTVQLAAGTYLTKQLVTYNFRGTFEGKGKDRTIIEALPELEAISYSCQPNTTDCIWPSLIIFVDGDIRVSDMAVRITAVPATKPYNIGDWTLTALIDAIRFMGQYRTNATLESVAISGMEDNSDTSFWGFNLANGVTFAGELPRSPVDLDYYFLSGTLAVSNSTFQTSATGVYPGGFIKDSHFVIGGRPGAGNLFENVAVGTDLEGMENSLVEVSHNRVIGSQYASIWVVPWCCYLPVKPSLFFIHDNNVRPAGPYADGIFLLDDPTNKWIYALIYNNAIEAQDIGNGGISAYSTKGTTILHNKISGSGANAIGIWDGTFAAVLGNDVSNFTTSPDLAQIVLDGTTTHGTVLCKSPSDSVMNLGMDNKLIGCQDVESSVNSSKLNASSHLRSHPALKKKPSHR